MKLISKYEGVLKMQNLNISKQFFKDVWNLTKGYWQSEAKIKAFVLLAIILVLKFGSVYLDVWYNDWSRDFDNALFKKSNTLYDLLITFGWLSAIYIAVGMADYYFNEKLIIDWRCWLTESFLNKWLTDKAYYNLQMFNHDTDNPDQRISDDIKDFVSKTLSISLSFLTSFTRIISFSVILYNLSSALEISVLGKNLQINGSLCWIALLYAIFGTYTTHYIGKKLVAIDFDQQRYEADFRFSMVRMRENAESIAFYSGEKQEKLVFSDRFKLLIDNFWKYVNKALQIIGFRVCYKQIASILPYFVCLNYYLTHDSMELGNLTQIANAFSVIQGALSYFVDSYIGLAAWQAVTMRLTTFNNHMQEISEETEKYNPERLAIYGSVEAKDLQVNLPNGEILLKPMNIVLEAGKNVLIKGKSGCGKSTLLRAISGIWPFGEGSIKMPNKEQIMFIPQKPYLPLGTLRDGILYPGNKNVTDEELIQLLEQCQIGYLKDQLSTVADWSHVLSVGEQQRLAFVRVFIQKPQWLFLDEATSALDEATEARMYMLLGEKLSMTTLVSVAHRSTLKKFHQIVLDIDKESKSVSLYQLKE